MSASFEIPISNMDEDFAKQTHSGPHVITADMRLKHKELQVMARDQLPIRDIFKRSDCDMLYRYLIARKWDVAAAAEAIRENNAWREKNNINSILSQNVEDWGDLPQFIGVDRDGYPIIYNTPNTQILLELLKTKPKDLLIHRHFIAMERARYLCKKYNADRISCVLDLTHVTMSGITQVVSFLKESSGYDQKYYPETMRRMIVCNGGWAITGAWKGIKNFIDPRTQQKISFVGGPPTAKVLTDFIDMSQIPKKYGGDGDVTALTENFKVVADALTPVSSSSTAGGTPLTVKASIKVSPVTPCVATPVTVVTSPRPNVEVQTGVQKHKYESPRLGDEDELSDTETFYSLPSTDDESELGNNSSGIVIHSANICDSAIEEATKKQMALRMNPSLHSNPRAAAVEVVPIPVTSPMTSRADSSNSSVSSPQKLGLSDEESELYTKLSRSNTPFTIHLGFTDGAYTASVGGVVIGRKMDSIILYGSSDTLMMSIQKEAGHPVHPHPMLVTPKKQARYVMRRARLSDEFAVFDIHGDRTVVSDKDMKGKCTGDKIHRYTITQLPKSKDLKDWHVWRKGNRFGEDFFMWKQGRVVEVSEKMLSDGNTPETIVSMVLALTTLWYCPCETA